MYKIGGRRGVEASQQLVYDNQELHLPRLLDEALFHLVFEEFDLVHCCVFGLIEMLRKHPPVDTVLAQPLRESLHRFLLP